MEVFNRLALQLQNVEFIVAFRQLTVVDDAQNLRLVDGQAETNIVGQPAVCVGAAFAMVGEIVGGPHERHNVCQRGRVEVCHVDFHGVHGVNDPVDEVVFGFIGNKGAGQARIHVRDGAIVEVDDDGIRFIGVGG